MFSELFDIAILFISIATALFAGIFIGRLILIRKKDNLSKKFRREAAGVLDAEFENSFISSGFARKILNYLVKISYSINHVNDQP